MIVDETKENWPTSNWFSLSYEKINIVQLQDLLAYSLKYTDSKMIELKYTFLHEHSECNLAGKVRNTFLFLGALPSLLRSPRRRCPSVRLSAASS
jgi:hypothetical protein